MSYLINYLRFQLEDAILNVALDRFQITTRPPSHIAQDISNSSKFVMQRIILKPLQ